MRGGCGAGEEGGGFCFVLFFNLDCAPAIFILMCSKSKYLKFKSGYFCNLNVGFVFK